MEFIIQRDDPRKEDITALLQTHLDFCMSVTPIESVYALDVEKLCVPEVTVFSALRNDQLLAVGALRKLTSEHGELKSMHTSKQARGAGVGTEMVKHIIDFAKAEGLKRVSLETGNYEPFAAARNLYSRFGFIECEPFGEYRTSDISVCITLEI